MKHYTVTEASKEIGKSISWRVAKRVAIKKWKEIIEYGDEHYGIHSCCGYCFVEENRTNKGLPPEKEYCGKHCPATKICSKIKYWSPKRILEEIKKLKR